MAYAEAPKGETKWEQVVRNARAFAIFLYDKEKGEVMGRNAESWGKITIFFVIFYLCLAAFFAGMLNAFLATMPDIADGPKLTQYLAGTSAIRVTPSYKISNFDASNNETYLGYVDSINSFLESYKDQKSPPFAANYCDFNSLKPLRFKEDQCKYDLSQLGPCYSTEKDFSYGFGNGTPCFFMKLNKVFNWVPKPDDGLSYAKVECDADADVYPKDTPGFPVSFYPFSGQEWLAPIVAVRVKGTSNTQVKCSVIGKNIERSDTYLLERGAVNRIRISIK